MSLFSLIVKPSEKTLSTKWRRSFYAGETEMDSETPSSETNTENTFVTAKYSAKENDARRQAGQSCTERQYLK
ncbi:hypothetical protein RRG08_000433 [Elysia crispata]|uniref:Uncharacterized protein n=1 Tax=Elysia crispata TaxID=231223 RepID=A0AAE0YCW8_9GAST|nr:hypothetical protein RRG08_000433 [Elysia crispata]